MHVFYARPDLKGSFEFMSRSQVLLNIAEQQQQEQQSQLQCEGKTHTKGQAAFRTLSAATQPDGGKPASIFG